MKEWRSTCRVVGLVPPMPKTLKFDPVSAETLDCIFPHILSVCTKEERDEDWMVEVQIKPSSSVPSNAGCVCCRIVWRRHASSQRSLVVSELMIRDQGVL